MFAHETVFRDRRVRSMNNRTEKSVMRDWREWSRFVRPGGRVAFHDARMFEKGWPTKSDGRVEVVQSLFRNQRWPGWRIVDEVHSLVIVERT
jgi:hypothetical protein